MSAAAHAVTRSEERVTPSGVTDYFAFEWLKFRRRPMPLIILALVLALIVLAFWGQATRSASRGDLILPRAWLAALAYSSFFAPFFWPVLGGSWAGQEYGWGTIRSILTRRPNRMMQVVAALVILLLGLLVALIATLVVATLAGLGVASFTGQPLWTSGLFGGTFAATLVKGVLTTWFVAGFYLLLAYSAAVISRSTAVGIGFGIGSTLAEVVLREIFGSLGGVWTQIADHFPFVYSDSMITRVIAGSMIPGTNLARTEPGAPNAGASLIALTIYGVVLLAAALIAVRSRDVTA